MKVWKRVLIKTLIFLLAVGAAGFAGIAYRESRQSGAEDILSYYAEKLIANEQNRAYACLDNGKGVVLGETDFAKAAEARKYSMYAGYRLEKLQDRVEEDTEYEDYKLTLLNSADEVQAEETITAVKEREKRFLFFDEWRVLPDHCMISDYQITVPAGSTLYLDGKQAETDWMTSGKEGESGEIYTVPKILPGKVSVVVQHPALEDLKTELDTTSGAVDLCSQMKLNEGSRSSCFETGVQVLKDLYSVSIKGDSTQLSKDLFGACEKKAKEFVADQDDTLATEEGADTQFVSIAVSGFNPQYGEPVYFINENGSIQVEVQLAYHYLGKFETTVYVENGEYDADGYPITEASTQEDPRTGDTTAVLTLTYQQDGWILTDLDVPLLFA